MKNNVLQKIKKIGAYVSVLTLTLSSGSMKGQTALLGMTQLGGSAANCGAAFNYNINSNVYNANAFNGTTNGAQPNGSFINASNGNIYGMVTYDAGGFSAGGNGYLLQYDANNNIIIPLFNFTGTTGAFPGARPFGALIEGNPGVVYGMTQRGGANNGGVIFSYTLSTNTYSVLYNFISANGWRPQGTLIKASNGLFYGMTSFGGINNNGVIFSFDASNGTYTKLVDFTGITGSFMGGNPIGSLIEPTPGLLYGLTNIGGSANAGILFEYNIATSAYNVKYNFPTVASGNYPKGSLLKANNGMLYGFASNGGSGNGVLFEYDMTGSGTYTPKINFTGTSGLNPGGTPQGALIQGSDGNLYGMTFTGGSLNSGVIFGYNLSTPNTTVLVNFSGNSGNNVGSYATHGNLLEYTLCLAPSISAAQTNVSCFGNSNGSATISATNNAPYTYTWMPSGGNLSVANNLSAGNYTCTTTNSCGVTTQTFIITEPAALTVTAIAGNPTICAGSSSTLTANAGGGTGTITYTWVAGPTNSINVVNPNTTTNYTVDVADANGCTNSATLTQWVNTLPTVTSTTNLNSICAGQNASLTAGGALTYTWNTNSTNTVIVITPTITTTYTVYGTDANGCINSSTVTEVVNNLPAVNAVSNLSLICIGQTATLTASGANTYTWNTSSNNTVIAVSPTITTTYTVNGTDANGCENLSVITQSVSTCTGILHNNVSEKSITIYPNPFNDKLTVAVSENINTPVQIFNALGELIYTAEITNNKLEINLRDQPTGIYFIHIGTQKTKMIKQ